MVFSERSSMVVGREAGGASWLIGCTEVLVSVNGGAPVLICSLICLALAAAVSPLLVDELEREAVGVGLHSLISDDWSL